MLARILRRFSPPIENLEVPRTDVQATVSAGGAINIFELEAALDACFEKPLRKLRLGKDSQQAQIAEMILKHFRIKWHGEKYFNSTAEHLFGQGERTPAAMVYTSEETLLSDVKMMHTFSYFHYALARKRRMKSSFPERCCGCSSSNLVLHFWEIGIRAAALAYNRRYDHAYVIVPYVLASTGEKGVLLLDPTSDQLTTNKDDRVRNRIMILPPEDWTYITDWYRGANLYPEVIEASSCYGYGYVNYDRFVQEAVNNAS